jgi:hypothetical protein
MPIMAEHDRADDAALVLGEEQVGIGGVADLGDVAGGVVRRLVEAAGPPQRDDCREVAVLIDADIHVSTGVSPGRPHSVQEPS